MSCMYVNYLLSLEAINIKNMKYFWIKAFILCLLWTSCGENRTANFPKPVDTSTKPTRFPEKGEFTLAGIDVTVSNDFDASRLNNAKIKNDSTITLLIDAENEPINNSAYYAFKIWSKTPKKIYVELTYAEGFNHRYIPKIKTKDSEWTPLDKSLVKIDMPDEPRKAKSAIFPLQLTTEATTVAAQPIISSKDTKAWYTQLVKGKESLIKLKSVGKSVQGRDLPVLDIYDGSSASGRDIVVFLTRQHPPETTGFLAFQKFMETIIERHKSHPDFLKAYRVLAFPILNPDGVDLGNWRHNAQGVDLNRDWAVYNQPEVKQVAHFILDQKEEANARVVLGIDFHSTYRDVFYTNKNKEGMIMPNFVSDWFKGLEENISNYKVNNRPSNVGKPVSKGWFQVKHNSVGITYEMGDNTEPKRIKEIASQAAIQAIKILMSERNKNNTPSN